jgi:hypothetical protein
VATAVAIAAILAGVTTLRPTPRRASTVAPPATVTRSATTSVDASPSPADGPASATPSAALVRWILLDGENGPTVAQGGCAGTTSTRQPNGTTGCKRGRDLSSPDPASGIPAFSCERLFVAAALTLGADPAAWIATLIDSGGRPGQTIDQSVRQRLVAARTALERANQSDLEAINLRIELDSLIAETGREPCSSTVCTSDRAEPDNHRTGREDTGTRHTGWHWLCAS